MNIIEITSFTDILSRFTDYIFYTFHINPTFTPETKNYIPERIMEETKQNTDKRVWLGGFLIILGGLFLLNTLDILHFRFTHIVFSWPFFLFIIGLFILSKTDKKLLGGLLAGFGGIFLLPKIIPGLHISGAIIWPLILIAIGLYIILHKKSQHNNEKGILREDTIDDVAIFGGGNKVVTSKKFRGGNVTAIFGGSEINLTAAELAEGTSTIDVLAIFGGTDLIIPKHWNVIVNVTSILGGFSNKGLKDPSVQIDANKTLIVKGLVLFGGGEIKNYF